ncbi:hypothetical protein CPC08DRAFT_755869 [Agrocybe pediades]|nr:hypothetical protein CPC08DRAFT_755869 [Agrocybe pediades]
MSTLHIRDPILQRVVFCTGRSGKACDGRMGPFRVYQGKGKPDNAYMRGSIVQSCFTCHYTYFHPNAGPYVMDDAERLAYRLNNSQDPRGQPTTLRLSSPAVQDPTVSTQPGYVECPTTTCLYQNTGKRKKGAQACEDHYCRNCCVAATQRAVQLGHARRPCGTHKQPAVQARAPPPPAPTYYHPFVPAPTHVVAAPSPPATAPVVTAPPPAPTPVVVAPPPMPPRHESPPPAASPERSSSPVPPLPSPPHTQINPIQVPTTEVKRLPQAESTASRGLAQPVVGTWAGIDDTLNLNHQAKPPTLKSIKVQQYNMTVEAQKTVSLVVWYQNGRRPFVLRHVAQFFPQLRLSLVDDLVQEFKGETLPRFEFWDGTRWEIINMDHTIYVERGQNILLKLLRKLTESLEDCPGLDDEMKKQPMKARTLDHGKKRRAEDLVSPLAPKISKHLPNDDVHRSDPPSTTPPNIEAQNSEARAPKITTISSSRPSSDSVRSSSLPSLVSMPRPTGQTKLRPTPDSKPLADVASGTNTTVATQKEWPQGYFVYEISNGFTQIDTMTSRSRKGARITVRAAFNAAFPYSEYKKATYYDHKTPWDKGDKNLQAVFINLGNHPNAIYKRYLDATSDPQSIPSPPPPPAPRTPSPTFRGPSPRLSRSPSIEFPPPIAPDQHHLPFDRIRKTMDDCFLQDILQEYLLDPDESEFFITAKEKYAPSSSQRVIPDLQYQKYYSVEEVAMITSELEMMCPEKRFDPVLWSPLSWAAAIREILLPESIVAMVHHERELPHAQIKEDFKAVGGNSQQIKKESDDTFWLDVPRWLKPTDNDVIDLTLESSDEE